MTAPDHPLPVSRPATTSGKALRLMTMTPLAWVLMLALSVLWGGSFLFAKVAVAEVPPMTLVLVRVLLAALALHAVRLALRIPFTLRRGYLGRYALMGLLNNALPFTLIFSGQTVIGASLAAILNATTPFFTVAVTHLLLSDERAGAAKLAALVFGFAGVVAIVGPDALDALHGSMLAQVAVLGAALSYAFAGTWGRRFAAEPPIATACGQLTLSTLMMIPVALLHDKPWDLPLPSLPASLSVVALALLSTALAYVLFFRILAIAGATNVSLVTLLVPVSTALGAALFLGESLAPRHLAGFALIALGMALIDGRLLRRFRKSKRPGQGPGV